MRPRRSRTSVYREMHFEPLEDRVVLSAHSVADFSIDYYAEAAETQSEQRAATTLASAHDLSGLTDARNHYGFTGAGQTVAIIDSGIAYDHYALGGGFGDDYRVVGGWDFTEENDADPYDDGAAGSHGTHVAGIVGSSDATHTGVAPGVDLVALRVFNDAGDGWFTWIEDSLQWVHDNRNAFENPITTVNLSLGTDWNSDTLPNWANLEDEFAQLEDDGIFIAVAAGNSFTSYNEAGLSYPAVSQYVVPVASVDGDGSLSYFSQRNERVIAAPGSGITSTAPDYIGNFNYQTDDFATMSGTSMASPYVAGASVLLRQAYEFVGQQNVTQDQIYDLMQSTADSVWDPATEQSYSRLNISAALDAIMPDDDFGSTMETAHSLGTLADADPTALAGVIGQLEDVDYFNFTAGASGTVSFSVDSSEAMPEWIVSGSLSSSMTDVDGTQTLSFEVIAGQSYSLGLGADGGLAHYNLDVELEAAVIDWGNLDFEQLLGYSSSGEDWFTFSATHDGLLTIEAIFAQVDGNVDLELYDSEGHLLASSNGTSDLERIDIQASSGDTFQLKISGENSHVDLRVLNLVSQDGSTVHVAGTSGSDTFEFHAGATHQLLVNGIAYEFDASDVSEIYFDGGAGEDTAILTGTSGDETAALGFHSGTLKGDGYEVQVDHIEQITVYGNGGYDVATMTDTAGDDVFVGRPGSSYMTGDGYINRARGFDRVYAYASTGHDRALLFDSTTDDTFVARPNNSYYLGTDFYYSVRDFDRTYAYSVSGGQDTAHLYGSAGNDLFVGKPGYSYLLGTDYHHSAVQFDKVYARAVEGGIDSALLLDSAGDDRFVGRSSYSYLTGDDFHNSAIGFDLVNANSVAGGNDVAYLYDTLDADEIRAWSIFGLLEGDGYSNLATGFNSVSAFRSVGNDSSEVNATDFIFRMYGDW